MVSTRPSLVASLHWVREEVDRCLQRCRVQLEDYMENGATDGAALQSASGELRQVLGTTSLIQCTGAALLSREMLDTVQALGQTALDDAEAACGALLGATLQLGDYLDAVANGADDCALVLQPLINELRLARAAPVLTEAELFAAQLGQGGSLLPLPLGRRSEEAAAMARRCQPPAQQAMLQWLKDEEPRTAVARLGKAAEHMAQQAATEETHRLWRVLAAVAEVVLQQRLDASLELKRLVGRAIQQLKRCAESGEATAAAESGGLSYQLLFHVGRARPGGARVAALRRAFELDRLLPTSSALDALAQKLRGPNTELLSRLSDEIRSDLAQVKDTIDLVVRAGARAEVDLGATAARLHKLANTLGMLGLNVLQRVVQNQSDAVERLAASAEFAASSGWMDIATALLRAENSLDAALFRQLRRAAGAEAVVTPQYDEGTPPSADFDEGVAALLRESLVNLSKFKGLADQALKNGSRDGLGAVASLLGEIRAGFRILDEERAAGLVSELARYTEQPGFPAALRATEQTERFADAVACLEFYLEALQSHSPDTERLLDDLSAYIERLEYPESALPSAPAPAPAGEKQLDAVDPEIRDIFVEEAGEVLETLRGHLRPWLSEPENKDRLLEIRRAFHTLKGSGRMVGAALIGEFGWACENLLNQCRDGALSVNADVLGLIEDAVALLPALIDRFRDWQEPPEAAAALIERAEALVRRATAPEADMLAVFREDARGHLAHIHAWLAACDRNQAFHAVDTESLRGLHTLRGSAAIVGHGAISELSGSLEHYLESVNRAGRQLDATALDLLDDALASATDWLGRVPPPAELAPEWRERIAGLRQQLPAEAVNAAHRQQLNDRLTHEAFESLQQTESALGAWRAQAAQTAQARSAAMPLQAVQASARAADCDALARAAAAFEAALLRHDGAQAPAADFFELCAAVLEAFYALLDALRDGPFEGDIGALIEQIESLPAPVGPVVRPETEAAAAVPLEGHDPELVSVFLPEARELLARVEAGLAAWQQQSSMAAFGTEAGRALHTFKGSARMAGFGGFGDLAQMMETLLRSAQNGVPLTGGDLSAGMREVVSGLNAALDTVARGQQPELSGLLATLETYVERREPDAGMPEATAAPDLDLPEAADAAFAPEPDPPPPDEFLAPPPAPEPAAEDSTVRPPDADPAPAGQAGWADVASPLAPAAPPPSADDDDAAILDIFRAEASELLEQMESALEVWRARPTDRTPLNDLQRVLHTLKGGARMAGQAAMGAAVHEMESLVEDMARGDIPTDDIAFDQLHTRFEQLQHMHDRLARGEALEAEDDDQPIEAPYDWPPPEAPAPAPEAAPPAADAGPQAPLDQWDPELLWRPQDEQQGWIQQRRELARVPVERLDDMLNQASEMSIFRSRLDQCNAATGAQLAEMAETIVRVREQLRRMEIETEAQIAARGLRNLSDHEPADRYGPEFDPLEMDRYSRMQELSRALTESVSDLSSLHASLSDVTEEAGTLLQQQGRVTTEVQQGLMGTLMVPFSRQVARLQRVVRQTATETGKQVDIHFDGIEAELDRKVLERMTAPLEHLLRNAVVHGIEPPMVRSGLGKPETGQVLVSLKREGPQLVIELSDDGRGLDISAIREQAVQRGLLPPNVELSESQVAQFIFEPGFSTARELTQSAGRGVGMDVVSAEVKQLGGTLDLETEAGGGTRFAIHLPLTLAVSQALLANVGGELYAVPLSSIEGIARVPRAQLDQYFGDSDASLHYGGADYQLRYLGDYLGVQRSELEKSRTVPVILIRVSEGIGGAERHVGLVVDTLLGNREVVTKAVGPQVSSIVGVSGATILSDGAVVLILDVAALVQDRTRRALLAEAHSAAAPRADERASVMVVDDSITMRRVAERLLTRHGYRVLTARDGLDAMAQLATEQPAVVLLDIEMPKADGFEVAAFIRNNERLGRVPIIMITSRSGDKHRERAFALGVDRYLIKPYQEDQLLSEIRGVIV